MRKQVTRPDPRNVMNGPHQLLLKPFVALVSLSGLAIVAYLVSTADLTPVPYLGPAFYAVAGLLLISELRPLLTAGAHDVNGVALSTAYSCDETLAPV